MTPVKTDRKDDAVTDHKVRTSINPGVVLKVGDAELLDLTRQGLVLDDDAVAKIEAAEAAEVEKTEAEAVKAAAKDEAAQKRGPKKES